jgi:hypothetical protein
MKPLSLIAFLFLSALPVQASPPRLFKKIRHAIVAHRLLLAEAAAMETSAEFDIHSSEAALRRCPSCEEGNIFLPDRPSPAEFQGDQVAWTIGMSAANQYELSIGNDPGCEASNHTAWCKKGFWKGLTLTLTGEVVGLHAYGTYRNNEIK